MTENKKIGVDFDGVLCDRTGVPRVGSFSNDPPSKDAKNAIKWMIDKGYEPYVFTNRVEGEWPMVKIWLDEWEFPEMKVTNVKQPGTFLYIDDRAIRFTNFQDVCKLLG